MYQPIRTPHHLIAGLAAVLLAAGLSACSQEPNNTDSKESQGEAARTTPARPTVKRDLSTFDICARVPAADVAGILGSTPDRISAKATMLSYAADCTYTIERGDGMKDYAMVWLYSPQMWAPTMAGEVEKIEGLGDDAYLEKGSIDTFNKINVLVEGDFMLDTRANSLEQARGLAELALERLSGESG